MQQVVLGRTGLKVSRLSLGGLFVASFAAELEEAKRAVRRAVELGINYIDTAPGYGNSEEVLGKALAGVSAPVILSTKLGGKPEPFKPQDRDCLMASVENSLKLLGRDRIDILMIHEPDRPGQYDWWTDWHDLKGPALDVLHDLKRQGVIGHIGLGGTTVHELTYLVNSGRFDVVLTAYNYSMLWQESGAHVIPAARRQKMGVVVGSPLQQGALARKYDAIEDPGVYWLSPMRREQFRRIYRLADECGVTVAELGLRFVLSNPDVDTVLMGARSVAEVEQNVAAAEKGALPADVLRRINEIAAEVPYRPFNEPFGIGWFLPNARGYRGAGRA